MSVVEAVKRDLEAFGGELAETSLAASALALAVELDADNSATSKSMCAKALMETMERLRELAPPKQREDDELERVRAQRRSGRRPNRASAS